MNKYIAPEYKKVIIETEDVITTSNFIFEDDGEGNATVTGNLADLIG